MFGKQEEGKIYKQKLKDILRYKQRFPTGFQLIKMGSIKAITIVILQWDDNVTL